MPLGKYSEEEDHGVWKAKRKSQANLKKLQGDEKVQNTLSGNQIIIPEEEKAEFDNSNEYEESDKSSKHGLDNNYDDLVIKNRKRSWVRPAKKKALVENYSTGCYRTVCRSVR